KDVRLARVPPLRANARLVPAGDRLNQVDDSANTADNRSQPPHLSWQKNQHSLAPVFLPRTSAGKRFLSCEPRQKICLRSSNRGSQARDTLFRSAEGVRVFSCAFDCKRVTTVRNATSMHKCSLGIAEEIFNHDFRRGPVRDLCFDDSMVTGVSTKNAAAAKLRWIFVRRLITLARLRMDKNRSSFWIWITRWNRSIRTQDY